MSISFETFLNIITVVAVVGVTATGVVLHYLKPDHQA